MAYQVKNHKIEIYDENKCIYVPYCEEFRVEEVITDFVTGKKRIRVKIYAYPEDETVELPRGAINRTIVPQLIDYGLTIPDTKDDAEFAIEILIDSLANAKYRSEHSRLGFVTRKDEKYFLLYKPIRERDGKILDSQYLENEKMKPKGTLSSWKEFINEEVLGHPTLELALGLSAVAPIAHMLHEAKYLSSIPMFALIGESSTSKTTTLKLMASVWGNPDENSGIISDLACSQNAFFEQLSANSGIPALFDECSVIPDGWQLSSALYMIPKGKSKLRCDTAGALRKISRFSGAVIFTGEQDLLQMGRSLRTRIFETIDRVIEICASHSNRTLSPTQLSAAIKRVYNINMLVEEVFINFKSPPLIEEAAKKCQVTPQGFTKLFKRTTNRKYHEFVTAIRVMKAVVLLKYTQKSIAEISAEYGYVDSPHFIKTTNKIFGSSPHRLRKEMIEISQRYKDQKIASEKLYKWESTLDSETRLEHFKISLGEDIIST